MPLVLGGLPQGGGDTRQPCFDTTPIGARSA